VRASPGRPSIYLLLAILGASDAIGACSPRSVPQTRPRVAPSTIEPSQCDASSTIDVPGTSNIFGAGIADPPAPAGGGGGTVPPCVSFPSTATSILIRASGTVGFLTRVEDDAVPSIVASVDRLRSSRCRRGRTVRQRGRAPPLPRRRRSPPIRRRSQPWARSRGSRPPTAAGTLSVSSSPIRFPPDHRLRPWTSPGIATSLPSHPRWPRPSSSAMAVPPPVDRSASMCQQEPRGCTSGWGMLGGSRVRRASTRITADRSRWRSASVDANFAHAVTLRRSSPSALGLPQHPDQHRPERPVLLAVDQQLAWPPGR
jgi:hypothetical protein